MLSVGMLLLVSVVTQWSPALPGCVPGQQCKGAVEVPAIQLLNTRAFFQDVETQFKFGDQVTITRGFYRGLDGTVEEFLGSFDEDRSKDTYDIKLKNGVTLMRVPEIAIKNTSD